MELSGTKVVVIGGTSGIGRAVAARVAALGADIVVASSSGARVDAARRDLPAGAVAVTVDVTDEEQVAALFEQVGSFDHLVYTAGDWGPLGGSRLRELDLGRAGQVFAVRFWAPSPPPSTPTPRSPLVGRSRSPTGSSPIAPVRAPP